MEVRGKRECRECGTHFSYFETGSVACPECGSIRSVGRGERLRHTDQPVDLDLSHAKTVAADRSLREAAEAANEAARSYVHSRGFIKGGELEPLDETYVAAEELRHVASAIRRRQSLGEHTEYYFLQLLDGAPSGSRPEGEAVPEDLEPARGLAVATAVRAYRGELRTWFEDEPTPDAIRGPLDRLDSHTRRIEALDGAVDLQSAEVLLEAARGIGDFLRAEEGTEALKRAESSLDRLDDV
ncbi:MAG: TFIIB-type zinc ribbon-containing protein [Halodesulfurarchaeum sp.]